MTDYNRQELQDNIFRMYASIIDAAGNKAKNAPVEIDKIKKFLTGGGVYQEVDFETELNYLVDAGYFQRYGASNIIPTAEGINRIWGSTSHRPKDAQTRQLQKHWWEQNWFQLVMLLGALAGVVGLILFLIL